MSDVQDKASVIWSAAGKPWNDHKPYDYQKEIHPISIVRRMDCVPVPTKDKVLKEYEKAKKAGIKSSEPLLNLVSRHTFLWSGTPCSVPTKGKFPNAGVEWR